MLPGTQFYLDAFGDLSTERSSGFGSLGRIPWSKIVEYGERAGLDPDMLDAFVVILRGMDEAYIGWQEEQADKHRSKTKGSRKPAAKPRRGRR